MRQLGEYCIHVNFPDGTEITFPGPPDRNPYHSRYVNVRDGVLVHHVFLLELDDGSLVEETKIVSVPIYPGYQQLWPKAHGRGWTQHDISRGNSQFDAFVIWRRPYEAGR